MNKQRFLCYLCTRKGEDQLESYEVEVLAETDGKPEIAFADLLILAPASTAAAVRRMAKGSAIMQESTHVVCFENLDLSSPAVGERAFLVVGPKNARTLAEALATPIGTLPSQFKYAVAYAAIPKEI